MRTSKFVELGFVCLLLISIAHAATGKGFREDTTYPGAGQNVIVTDFNRDGKPDAVGFGATDQVWVYLGNGHGFSNATTYTTGGKVADIVTGDFNGDGITDIATLNDSDTNPGVSVLFGNGDGTFQAHLDTPLTSNDPLRLAARDFNRDGKADLVISDFNFVTVYLNNGDGTFHAGMSLAGGSPYSADLNRDGLLDLIITTGGAIEVHLGNGDGTFQDGMTFNAAVGDIAFGDLNGDGKLDIVGDISNLPFVSVLLGNGDGTLQPVVTYASGPDPLGLTVGDFDKDGHADVAVAGNISLNVSILFGNGDGTLKPWVGYASMSGAGSIAAADVNGDNTLDLVLGAVPGLEVLQNTGKGSFLGARQFGTGQDPYAVATGDFNGDGKADLITADNKQKTVSVLLGNGDGTFKSRIGTGTGKQPTGLALGDFNSDGKLDAAVLNASSFNVLLGKGDGTFNIGQKSPPVVGDTYGVSVGDLNGDGKLDVVVISTYKPNIYLGNGDGTFRPGPVISSESRPASLAIGDLNGDGKLDLVVGQYDFSGGPGGFSVLLGNGDGSFGPLMSFGSGAIVSVVIADFNGDGHMDLAGAINDTTQSAVLLGNGDGTFEAPTTVSLSVSAATDLNRDGKIDLISGGYLVTVLLGQGDGTFAAPQTFPAGHGDGGTTVGNFNQDLYPDIAVADTLFNPDLITILLNAGNGN